MRSHSASVAGSLTFPVELAGRLKRIARTERIPVEELVRFAINDGLRRMVPVKEGDARTGPMTVTRKDDL